MKRVGRYVIVGELPGAERANLLLGSGSVDGEDTPVVLKRLNSSEADIEEEQRRVLLKLQHPGIIRHLEYIGTGTERYLVMEHVRGVPLTQIIRRHTDEGQPLAVDVVLALLLQAVAATRFLHEFQAADTNHLTRLIHGDLNPGNVLITAEGIVKIVDFGLSQVQSLKGDRVTSMAHPQYASYNRLHEGRLDVLDDVFALGVCFYELAAGQRFWGKATREQIFATPAAEFCKDPRLVNPEIDRAVAELIISSLRHEGFSGFGSAAEFHAELVRVAQERGWTDPEAVLASYMTTVFPTELSASDVATDLNLTLPLPEAGAPLAAKQSPSAAPAVAPKKALTDVAAAPVARPLRIHPQTAQRRRLARVGVAVLGLVTLIEIGILALGTWRAPNAWLALRSSPVLTVLAYLHRAALVPNTAPEGRDHIVRLHAEPTDIVWVDDDAGMPAPTHIRTYNDRPSFVRVRDVAGKMTYLIVPPTASAVSR